MELSAVPPEATAAAAAAADPPPFSGPATPSASSILSRRMSWGSGGSSSWAPRMLRPAARHTQRKQRVSESYPRTRCRTRQIKESVGSAWCDFSICRYELTASSLCCCCLSPRLFSKIYTLHCTLCVQTGWHDSNIHKLTNAQWWSGTCALWKDAKQRSIPAESICDFDTWLLGVSKPVSTILNAALFYSTSEF